jgi:L-threonylcarbamoyladenylate synthase
VRHPAIVLALASKLAVDVATAALRAGGVVVHATEGVWGLACDPFDGAAVARLLSLKGRAPARGLIVIGACAEMFAAELAGLSRAAADRVRASWPGADTWVVPNERFPRWITGARATIAIRVPGHAQARALSAQFGAPLVSTSANPSGRPPAQTELAARRYFHGRVDCVLAGATCGRGQPSRIRDAVTGRALRG